MERLLCLGKYASRRMQDQGDGSNFYLIVKPREDSPVFHAVNKEPASIFGDVNLGRAEQVARDISLC